jgi:hypothetical protein
MFFSNLCTGEIVREASRQRSGGRPVPTLRRLVLGLVVATGAVVVAAPAHAGDAWVPPAPPLGVTYDDPAAFVRAEADVSSAPDAEPPVESPTEPDPSASEVATDDAVIPAKTPADAVGELTSGDSETPTTIVRSVISARQRVLDGAWTANVRKPVRPAVRSAAAPWYQVRPEQYQRGVGRGSKVYHPPLAVHARERTTPTAHMLVKTRVQDVTRPNNHSRMCPSGRAVCIASCDSDQQEKAHWNDRCIPVCILEASACELTQPGCSSTPEVGRDQGTTDPATNSCAGGPEASSAEPTAAPGAVGEPEATDQPDNGDQAGDTAAPDGDIASEPGDSGCGAERPVVPGSDGQASGRPPTAVSPVPSAPQPTGVQTSEVSVPEAVQGTPASAMPSGSASPPGAAAHDVQTNGPAAERAARLPSAGAALRSSNEARKVESAAAAHGRNRTRASRLAVPRASGSKPGLEPAPAVSAKRPWSPGTAAVQLSGTRSSTAYADWVIRVLVTLLGLVTVSLVLAFASERISPAYALTAIRSRLGSKALSTARIELDASQADSAGRKAPGIRYRD